jgi:replicative DNA helicase
MGERNERPQKMVGAAVNRLDAEDIWLAALCHEPDYRDASRVLEEHLSTRAREIYRGIDRLADQGWSPITLEALGNLLGTRDREFWRGLPARSTAVDPQAMVTQAETVLLACWARGEMGKAYEAAAAASRKSSIDDAEAIIERAREHVSRYSSGLRWRHPAEVGREVLEAMRKGASEAGLHASGFDVLDTATRGWAPKQCTIIGARTSDGKSTLLDQVLTGMALRGTSVARIDLEDEPTIGVQRQMVRLMEDLDRAVRLDERALEMLDFAAWERLIEETIENLPMQIVHKPDADARTVASAIHDCARLFGVKVVGVDYIQALGAIKEPKHDLPRAMGQFKEAAAAHGIHLIVASQLGRPSEKNPMKEPSIWDNKGASGLEERAENMAMVHRHEKGKHSTIEPCRIIVGKAKSSQPTRFFMHWNVQRHCFEVPPQRSTDDG